MPSARDYSGCLGQFLGPMPGAFGGRFGVSREGGLPTESRLVIRGGCVALFDDKFTVLSDGAVAIEGGRIAAVGSAADVDSRYGGGETVDASGKLVMPGLINAHTHLYSALARGLVADIAPSANFTETLEHMWWRLDRALTLEDVRLSAAAGAVDLVRNGTTTIVDHHASQVNVDGSLDAVSEALRDAGLRFNLCFEVSERDGAAAREAGLHENERFARKVAGRTGPAVKAAPAPADSGDGRQAGASVGLHASFTLDDDTLERAAAMASDLGVGCHIHAAEDIARRRGQPSEIGQARG